MTVTVIALVGSTYVECALHEVDKVMFENLVGVEVRENGVKIGRIPDWELFKKFMDQYEMYCEAQARRIWRADSTGANGYSPCVAALKDVLPSAVVAHILKGQTGLFVEIQSKKLEPKFFNHMPFNSNTLSEVEAVLAMGDFCRVYNSESLITVAMLRSIDDLHNYIKRFPFTTKDMPTMQPETIGRTEFQEAIDKIQAAVNPSHYKAYIEDLQWLDAMSRIPTLRKPERFIAAVELQIRKYMDRNGGKDAPLQEFKKAHFYMSYIIKYMENDCKPIKAADIHAWLQSL